MDYSHTSVLLGPVLELLAPAQRTTVVDCTLGGGGHSRAILDKLPDDRWLIGIDQDGDALAAAKTRLSQHNVKLIQGNFSQLKQLLSGWPLPLDGFLFDLGVSSWQLDNPQRGFAYQHDAPLDMRMDQNNPLTAAQIVNSWPEQQLAAIFRRYGEDRWAARIAQFIARRRKDAEVVTTGQLVEIIKAAIPAAARRHGGHPARRVFQALRIAVNAELDSLEKGLAAALDMCATGGVVVVISYHSLEDRIVKGMFRELCSGCICPAELPVCVCNHRQQFKLLTRKPVVPEQGEIQANPRARSARLRAVQRLSSKQNRG